MRDQPASSGDPYATLGLERGATMAEVKRAYRRLAKAFHPDSAGESALPRFLAIHEAYESIRTGRPMARSRGATTATGAPEPWRADPERARAARERSARRRASGPGTAGSARSGGAPGGGAAPGRGGSRPGDAGAAGGTGASGTTGAGRSGPTGTTGSTGRTGTSGGPRAGGRRNVRKATMGSTSYDDARDPNDASWTGASWYGPSTGEYWIVNPREYADPRKHGPEYQSRARRPPGGAEDEIGEIPIDGSGTTVDDPATGPDAGAPVGATARADAEAGDPAAPWSARPGVRARATAARPEPFARPDRPRRGGWTGPPAEPASAARVAGPAWDATWPGDARTLRRARGAGLLGGTPREWIGGAADDPIRRLGVALVAWPPVGLAAAALIGDLTGCSAYSADCGGTEPLLPWLAQAVILGLLLLLPPIARVLAGGSIGVLFALVPVTAFLVAVGGSGAPQAGFALTFLLVVAWLAGVGWGAWQQLRPSRSGAAR